MYFRARVYQSISSCQLNPRRNYWVYSVGYSIIFAEIGSNPSCACARLHSPSPLNDAFSAPSLAPSNPLSPSRTFTIKPDLRYQIIWLNICAVSSAQILVSERGRPMLAAFGTPASQPYQPVLRWSWSGIQPFLATRDDEEKAAGKGWKRGRRATGTGNDGSSTPADATDFGLWRIDVAGLASMAIPRSHISFSSLFSKGRTAVASM